MAGNGNGWRGIIALVGSGVAMFGLFTVINLTVVSGWCDTIEVRADDREIRIRAVEKDIAEASQWRRDTTRRLDEIKLELRDKKP